jgi:hypothetical protein
MSLIRLFGWLPILTAALALSSCSTNISYDRDKTISIPHGASVAFANGTSEGRENVDPAVGNEIVHQRIQSAIARELQAKGFKLVDDAGSADFLVRYFVRMNRNTGQVATQAGLTRTPATGPGWGVGWNWGPGVSGTSAVQAGAVSSASFIVDLVERSSGKVAWRGTWQGDPGPRAPTQQEIDNTMARIFRSAPTAG